MSESQFSERSMSQNEFGSMFPDLIMKNQGENS